MHSESHYTAFKIAQLQGPLPWKSLRKVLLVCFCQCMRAKRHKRGTCHVLEPRNLLQMQENIHWDGLLWQLSLRLKWAASVQESPEGQ